MWMCGHAVADYISTSMKCASHKNLANPAQTMSETTKPSSSSGSSGAQCAALIAITLTLCALATHMALHPTSGPHLLSSLSHGLATLQGLTFHFPPRLTLPTAAAASAPNPNPPRVAKLTTAPQPKRFPHLNVNDAQHWTRHFPNPYPTSLGTSKWGSYRPHTYFGLKTTHTPHALATGIIWGSGAGLGSGVGFRHDAAQGEMNRFEWCVGLGLWVGFWGREGTGVACLLFLVFLLYPILLSYLSHCIIPTCTIPIPTNLRPNSALPCPAG